MMLYFEKPDRRQKRRTPPLIEEFLLQMLQLYSENLKLTEAFIFVLEGFRSSASR